MNKMKTVFLPAILMAFMLPTGVQASDAVEVSPVKAGPVKDDPHETEKALNILIRHADQVIPESSSCYGHYAGTDEPVIRNVLTTSLASLYNGKNVITGFCSGNYCTVDITHRAGEVVSSTTIYFSLKEGRIDPANLECIISP